MTTPETPLEHYGAAAAVLKKIESGDLTTPGVAAYAAVARAHLEAAELLLRIQDAQRLAMPTPQVRSL